MRKRDLLARIEALEERVGRLEGRKGPLYDWVLYGPPDFGSTTAVPPGNVKITGITGASA